MIKLLKYIVVVFCLSLVGCFQPFDESLFEEGEPVLVVEGNINNLNPPYEIIISKTIIPESDINFSPVSNASVILRDAYNHSELLTFVGSGKYICYTIFGVPDNTYTLEIDYENERYTGVEKMPVIPVVDSFNIGYKDKTVSVKGYYFDVYIDKKKDTISYYKLDVSVNDSLFDDYSDLLIYDDAYIEGSFEIRVPYAFNIDDTVHINIQSITKSMYNYYYDLSRHYTNLLSTLQPPIQNPPSNISNQPIGYFQVSSIVQISEVVVAEETNK
ncbi:MAG: DUF4249 domain-containing protein [Salinivirgaceae bacterium]|nr:DUF4249 domain-containing protein [Salinivirgaceae bacterium]